MIKRLVATACCVSLSLLCIDSATADSPVVVHEWGTITTWHKPDGTPQGRLNRIDPSEVLPSFVHRFEPAQTQSDPERALTKSPLTPGRPDVTMRLETPVMYFYPGEDFSNDSAFSVEVSFRGGVINEFFPNATASVAVDTERIDKKVRAGVFREWAGVKLDNYVRGSIIWSITDLPVDAKGPTTEAPIWLAPRKVDSRYVEVGSGESEKYLFYRGVAHLEAMLQTRSSNSEVELLAPEHLHWLPASTAVIPKAWMVTINAQGEVAFRTIETIRIEKDSPSASIQRFPTFEASQFRSENLALVKSSMRDALIDEGLFQKEAAAMLATWNKSYFENAGTRIFYIVPSEWLDYHLPVDISIPHQLSRAFIGRIDLID